jgi:hypothetical protein
MKITREEANLLILEIINYHENDFKKLSQTDRKICREAIRCFSSDGEGIYIESISDKEAFIKFKERIHNTLDSEAQPKSFSIIRFLFKVILNFLELRLGLRLRLRITSTQLGNNLNLIKESFLSENWNLYLNKYCHVIDFKSTQEKRQQEEAQIFFLGDQHLDPIHNEIRKNIIYHYANEEDNNIVLEEGLETSFPKQLGNKKFVVENWDEKNHFTQHVKVMEETCLLTKSSGLSFQQIINLNQNEGLNLNPELFEKIRENSEHNNALRRERDKDLFKKVAQKVLEGNKKIFAISGSDHITYNEYLSTFMNKFHFTIFIPKESNCGKKNAAKFEKNVQESGNYRRAYVSAN